MVTYIVLHEFLLLFQFLKEVTNAVCDKTIDQPTTQTVRDNVLITQGPVVSYRSFKHGKRSASAIAKSEFNTATESLMQDGFGRIVEFRIPRARSTFKVFVKSKPNPCPNCTNVSVNEFDNALARPLHNDITVPMRQYLQANNYMSNFFTYKPISAISRDPESQGLSTRLRLPKKKSKTIGYKPRAKLLIVTGHLSKRTSRKT